MEAFESGNANVAILSYLQMFTCSNVKKNQNQTIKSIRNFINYKTHYELVELDTRLGTTTSEQLSGCVFNTLNLDIIKV